MNKYKAQAAKQQIEDWKIQNAKDEIALAYQSEFIDSDNAIEAAEARKQVDAAKSNIPKREAKIAWMQKYLKSLPKSE